jgi:hypothetical protein
MGVLSKVIDWSEVWALLIPLAIILFYRPKEPAMHPVIWYICIALVLNSISTTLYVFHRQMPPFLKNNNILYNLHSIARVIFFSWYISKITSSKFSFIYKSIISVYIIFIIVNFLFFESLLFFSSRLFAAESIVLLFLCISFFLRSLQDESGTNWTKYPSFIVCTAVALYEAITFFIFLFLLPMADKDPDFGLLSLEIYKITFVVFCILLARAIFRSKKQHDVAVIP